LKQTNLQPNTLRHIPDSTYCRVVIHSLKVQCSDTSLFNTVAVGTPYNSGPFYCWNIVNVQ